MASYYKLANLCRNAEADVVTRYLPLRFGALTEPQLLAKKGRAFTFALAGFEEAIESE